MIHNSAVTEFDAEVEGVADFMDLTALTKIGPNAKFGNWLLAQRTSLTEFNSFVGGECHLSGTRTLKVIGPKAIFNGGLDASRTAVSEFNFPVNGIADFNHIVGGELIIGPDAKCTELKTIGVIILRKNIEDKKPEEIASLGLEVV